jgi:hypothetical protein
MRRERVWFLMVFALTVGASIAATILACRNTSSLQPWACAYFWLPSSVCCYSASVAEARGFSHRTSGRVRLLPMVVFPSECFSFPPRSRWPSCYISTLRRAARGCPRHYRTETWRLNLQLISTGLALGLAIALIATPAIGSFLWGVRANDPLTYVMAAAAKGN